MGGLVDAAVTLTHRVGRTHQFSFRYQPLGQCSRSYRVENGSRTTNGPPNCPWLIWVHLQGPVQVKHQILRWWCHNMISERSCCDIMFEDNFCQIKVWMHSKIDQTSLFCAFIPLPIKKAWKKGFFSNNIKLGHLSFKWLLETGEAKTCKLHQYSYRSCWDLSLRDFNQKLMEVKTEKSQI